MPSGLKATPMLIAIYKTADWIRHYIGRLRLRQLNGAIMMISGLAVVAVPIIMANMHGHMDHGQMNHKQMNHEQMNHQH